MRIPNSLRRSRTPYDSTPNSPSAASAERHAGERGQEPEREHALCLAATDRLGERHGLVHHELRVERRDRRAVTSPCSASSEPVVRTTCDERPVSVARKLPVRVIHVPVPCRPCGSSATSATTPMISPRPAAGRHSLPDRPHARKQLFGDRSTHDHARGATDASSCSSNSRPSSKRNSDDSRSTVPTRRDSAPPCSTRSVFAQRTRHAACAPHVVVARRWKLRHATSRRDARQRGDPLGHRLIEARARGRIVARVRQMQLERQHAVRLDAKRDLPDPLEARDQQAGADEQHERERDLRHHEPLP